MMQDPLQPYSAPQDESVKGWGLGAAGLLLPGQGDRGEVNAGRGRMFFFEGGGSRWRDATGN